MKNKHNFTIFAMVLAFGIGSTTPAVAEKGVYPGANGKPFQALQQQITNLETYINEEFTAVWLRIDELQSAIDDANSSSSARDDAQDAIISLLGGALSALEARVTDNEDAIVALEAKDQVLEGLIDALDARANNLQNQIIAQGDRIDLLVLRDQALQQLIDALTMRGETLEGLMTIANADIDTLQSEVNTLKSRISSAETAIASKQNRIYESCPSGYSIWRINSSGSVDCAKNSGGFTSFTVTTDSELANANAVSAFTYTSVTATCPSGSKRTGGGFYLHNDLMFIHDSRPTGNNSWIVVVRGSWPVSSPYRSYIVCLTLN